MFTEWKCQPYSRHDATSQFTEIPSKKERFSKQNIIAIDTVQEVKLTQQPTKREVACE